MRRGLFFSIGLLLWVSACGGSSSGPRLSPEEALLREEFGIPAGARRVMVVSQSSHLDLNFLQTYDQYWESSVRSVLSTALDLLDRHPRYRYSVAEVAFLRRYWREVPEDRERLRRHAASGALQIVGGGISSPDSLLPTGESLLRDWLRGIRWVETNLGVTPTAAWQPDSFGHAPTLPSLLEHLGFDSVGFFRIDGGIVTVPASGPRGVTPSTASVLQDAGAADFLWRGPDGAELLARWMPFGYAQGDVLDFDSDVWAMSGLGIDWNVSDFVVPEITNDRFQSFIDQLDPLRRTPYLFLPIGVDFSWPKPELLAYIDRWNRERYPRTGVWIVPGTFADYGRLIEPHRAELPRFDFDMNPYWTGFYSTRIGLKQNVRRAHEALVAAEAIATLTADLPGATYPRGSIDRGWDRSAFMNHHDAITGTTTEESWEVDLIPWSTQALVAGMRALDQALAQLGENVDTSSLPGDRAIVLFQRSAHARSDLVGAQLKIPAGEARDLALFDRDGRSIPLQMLNSEGTPNGDLRFASFIFRSPEIPSVGHDTVALRFLDERGDATVAPVLDAAPTVRFEDDRVVLSNGRVRAEFDGASGYCLTSLRFDDGEEQLAGPAADVRTVLDLGGAYRLGSEIEELFVERASTCDGRAAEVEILEEGPVRVAVRVRALRDPAAAERIFRLGAESTRLDLEITAAAPALTTVLVRFPTRQEGTELTTSVPFGAATRPRIKLFDPTFWPVTAWIDIADSDGEGGLWMSAEGSRGWHVAEDGTVETVLTRNVGTEGLGPAGPDPERRSTHLAIGRRAGGSWLAGGTHRHGQAAHRPIQAVVTGRHGGGLPPSGSALTLDRPDVELAALKLAEGSPGDVVLRLVRYGDAVGPVGATSPLLAGRVAHGANGLEVAAEALPQAAGTFEIETDRIVETIRFLDEPPPR